MGDRSISASERQRLIADKADRDRIEGSVINEIRKVPNLVSEGVSSRAPNTRAINTTAPLQGGGDLSADRTLTIAVATTAAVGVVKQAAARADNASTIPTAAPAGGVGTAAGGWDTAANRDAAIATINGLRTALSELRTEHNDLLAKLRAAGVLA